MMLGSSERNCGATSTARLEPCYLENEADAPRLSVTSRARVRFLAASTGR